MPQGVTYDIRTSDDFGEYHEGDLVASGTLSDGYAGVDWLCLTDGCYELLVPGLDSGGASQEQIAELSFEFRDEVRACRRGFTRRRRDCAP